jgi:hypothetical protein
VAFGGWIALRSRLWHNEWRWAWDPDRVPPAWPYGAALWRGFTRITFMSGPALAALDVAFIAFHYDSAPARVVGAVFGAVPMTLLLLCGGIVLLNLRGASSRRTCATIPARCSSGEAAKCAPPPRLAIARSDAPPESRL